MRSSTDARNLLGGLAVLVGLASSSGCGGLDSSEALPAADETVGTSRDAVITWKNLTLINGWSAANGSTPAVAVINNVLTFRGAITGTSTAGNSPFVLPAGYRPGPGNGGVDSFRVRVVMANNSGGTLTFVLNSTQTGLDTHLVQDGLSSPGIGGRIYTSLDGIAVDMTSVGATALDHSSNGWSGTYSFRNQGGEPPASAKLVNGFVRFQGRLSRSAGSDLRLFTLPPNLRPANAVFVPVAFADCGAGYSDVYGRLGIFPNGDVYAETENRSDATANCGPSLESAAFSLTLPPTTLSLVGTWTPYSARSVRARDDGGVIRFQGSVWGGSGTVIATLPIGMRPSRSLYVVADAFGAAHARLLFEPNGNVSIDQQVLPTAYHFLSFDNVSFVR